MGLNGLYESTGVSGLEITSPAIALYGGLGLDDLQGKPVLPFGRRAVEGDLGEQVGPVESEAGVRKQL